MHKLAYILIEGNVLTNTQKRYVIAAHHEGMSKQAIADANCVNYSTVWRTLELAYKNLRAAGITPPADKQDAGTVQKCNAPTRRVVNLGWIDEIEG
jgi:hypothetical protein